jgi:hypothetical protein
MDLFDWVSGEIERGTSLDRLAARGMVRLALREAGLDPAAIDARQLGVVLERVLPSRLAASGITNADAFCAGLRGRVPAGGARGDTPEAIFGRLGGAQ